MIVIKICGGIGNQMFQYALYTTFKEQGKEVYLDIDGLDRQVKDFEPYNALEGGEDGLDFYRKITRESREFLNENGILAYEVGHDQASDVSKIMQQNGFKGIYTKSDLQGFERVVIGFYNN